MKIQEMRPGILHLSKKLDSGRDESFFDLFSGGSITEEPVEAPAPLILSELDQPRWSVVSFDRREARGLSYDRAAAFMHELDEKGIAGLCIVSDEAAERLKS